MNTRRKSLKQSLEEIYNTEFNRLTGEIEKAKLNKDTGSLHRKLRKDLTDLILEYDAMTKRKNHSDSDSD